VRYNDSLMEYQKDYRRLILLGVCILTSLAVILCPKLRDGIPLALLVGMFTCVLTVLLIDIYEYFKFRNALRDLDSKDWIGHAVESNQAVKHKTEKGKEINSFAAIRYLQDNILSITLTHETDVKPVTWEGVIEINKQVLNSGILTYKYIRSHEAGARQIIIHRDKEKIYIYLIPFNNTIYYIKLTDGSILPKYNYGIEVLIKDR
jgi:hypothetical protein